MPRAVRPQVRALLDSGRKVNAHTTIDLQLPGGPTIYLCTAEIYHSGDFDAQYLGKLDPNTGEFTMSLDPEVDGKDFKVANVDMVMGRTLTGQVNLLAGARGVLGIIFIDPLYGNVAGDNFYDAKMQGEITTGEVGDEWVDFSLVGDADVVLIAGETIASAFPYREVIKRTPVVDPDDLRREHEEQQLENFLIRFPGRYGEMGSYAMPVNQM